MGKRARRKRYAGSHERKTQQASHNLRNLQTVLCNREVWQGVIRQSKQLGREWPRVRELGGRQNKSISHLKSGLPL